MNTALLNAVREISNPNYRVLGQIGQGQFGQVFCGIHRKTGRMVALKRLASKQLTTPQFLHELHLLASLQHPNIVPFHTLEYDETGRYLIMDYCEGGTLRQLLDRQGSLELRQALKLITDIVQALAYAHEHGVVHCDLKPENVLLTLTETGLTAHLADFGVARLLTTAPDPDFRRGDTGSPAYMAPERFFSDYGPTSDLYAVGVMLYELITGQRPFSGVPGALMAAHLNQPIEIPRTIPLPVSSIIQQAMQKLPQKRFSSAREMLVSLQLATEVATALSAHVRAATALIKTPQIVAQEPLVASISTLVADTQQLYIGLSSQICCRSIHPTGLGEVIQRYPLDAEQVLQVWPCSEGLFVKTQAQSQDILSWISTSDQAGVAPQSETWQSRTMAVNSEQTWMVMVAPSSSQEDAERSRPSGQCQILQLPTLKPWGVVQGVEFPTQLLALDRRHGLAVIAEDDQGTRLRLFNRRGDASDYYRLPMSIEQVIQSRTHAYRLLGLSEAAVCFLIDLSPLNIKRVPLPFTPDFMGATDWGYWFADQEGALVLLDESGSRLGQLQIPLTSANPVSDQSEVVEKLTAITSLNPSMMIAATWSGAQGQLYTFDLKPWIAGDTSSMLTEDEDIAPAKIIP
ncbi:MAG: serine/threonine-protein kinase [Thermosynechococcaceae cyanobacterium]